MRRFLMKRLFALLAFCALASSVQAQRDTKYICSLAGMVTTDFPTKEECVKSCFQPGLAAVCEETGIDTEVDDTEDTEDIY